jgi:structure-specific recognition protein 1
MIKLRLCSNSTLESCWRDRRYLSRAGIGDKPTFKVCSSHIRRDAYLYLSLLGSDLAFLVSNKTSFEIPLSEVSNSNIAGRTEVSLEFTPKPLDGKKKKPDEMVEIRFYVPGTHTKERGSDAGSQKSDNENEDTEEMSAAQAFHDAIKEKAELGQFVGNLIVSFEEVLVLTPRGRYDVDMFPDFLRLRGKTYDYKIVYTSIARLFLLPKDDLHVLFIVSQSHMPAAWPFLY